MKKIVAILFKILFLEKITNKNAEKLRYFYDGYLIDSRDGLKIYFDDENMDFYFVVGPLYYNSESNIRSGTHCIDDHSITDKHSIYKLYIPDLFRKIFDGIYPLRGKYDNTYWD